MQRVNRSTFLGLLFIAGLAACGDKVTVAGPTSSTTSTPVVHGVTVTPATVNLQIGGTVTLVASVNADAGLARTVTWASTNTAIATVTSAGVVTAVAAGTATVTATSTADATQSGAAAIIVGATTVATISISTVNQTVCVVGGGCNSVPANLNNVAGQLDVTLNVDQGSQTVTRVDLIVGRASFGLADTTVASEIFTGSAANSSAANGPSLAPAPVTLSFNTAGFVATTGAAGFRNGVYTIKARATIAGTSTQSPVSSTLTYTLNNPDFIVVANTACGGTGQPVCTLAGSITGVSPGGLLWQGGTITATIIPVIYTPGRSVTTISVTADTGVAALPLNTVKATAPATPPGAFVAAFPISGTGNPNVGLLGISSTTFGAIISTIFDNATNGPTATVVAPATIRADQTPPRTPLAIGVNNAGARWINGTYAFGATAADYTANGDSTPGSAVIPATGVAGLVTAPEFWVWTKATFPATVNGAAGKAGVNAACVTTGGQKVTTGSQLTQSAANDSTTYSMRVIQKDVVGNATCVDLGFVTLVGGAPTQFGVDLGPPIVAFANALGGTNTYAVTANPIAGTYEGYLTTDFNPYLITATDSISGFVTLTGTASPLSVQIIHLPTTGITDCVNVVTGAVTTPVPAGGCPFTLNTGSAVSWSPTGTSVVQGYFTSMAKVSDKAGNSVTLAGNNVALDNTPPTASGGVAIPAALVGGTTISLNAAIVDNLTIMGGLGSIVYGAPANITINYPGATATPAGTFGTLNKTAQVSMSAANFISALQQLDATGAPTNPSISPASFNVFGTDEVGLSGGANVVIPGANITTGAGSGSGVVAGITLGDWTAADITTFNSGPAAVTTVSNGTGVLPRSVVLTATAVLPLAKGLPFTNVCWYYLNPQAVTIAAAPTFTPQYNLIGCQSAAVVTILTNTWTYTGPSFDPPANLGIVGTVSIIAIGYGVGGHAAATPVNVNLTLAN